MAEKSILSKNQRDILAIISKDKLIKVSIFWVKTNFLRNIFGGRGLAKKAFKKRTTSYSSSWRRRSW